MAWSFVVELRYADTLAMAVCAGSLLRSGLFRIYPFLFLHLLIESLATAVTSQAPVTSYIYLVLFAADGLLKWILWALIAATLSRKMLVLFPALVNFARWALISALFLALLATAATQPFGPGHYAFRRLLLPAILRMDQVVTAAIAIYLLLICTLLAWFAVPVARNSLRICLGLGFIFSFRSAAFLLMVIFGPAAVRILNPFLTFTTTAIFLALALTLSQRGERVAGYLARQTAPERVEARLRQLNELGDKLRPDGE